MVAKTSFSVPPSCSVTEVPSESRLQQEKPGSIWICAEWAAHEQNRSEIVRQRSADMCGRWGHGRNTFYDCGVAMHKKTVRIFFSGFRAWRSVLKTCPSSPYAGVARPLNYDDYKELALKSNCSYLGCAQCRFMGY